MFEKQSDMPLDFYVGLMYQTQAHNPYGKIVNNEELEICELPFTNNYSRVPMTQIDWISPDEITMYNACNIRFPNPSFDWGRVTHFGLFLTEKGYDCICIGDLIKPKMIYKGCGVNFAPLKIDILIETLEEAIKEFNSGKEYGIYEDF